MYLITVCVCVCVCEKDCLCLRVWHMDLIIVRVYMCACVTYAGPVMPDRIQERHVGCNADSCWRLCVCVCVYVCVCMFYTQGLSCPIGFKNRHNWPLVHTVCTWLQMDWGKYSNRSAQCSPATQCAGVRGLCSQVLCGNSHIFWTFLLLGALLQRPQVESGWSWLFGDVPHPITHPTMESNPGSTSTWTVKKKYNRRSKRGGGKLRTGWQWRLSTHVCVY